jgi:hypothetical protein
LKLGVAYIAFDGVELLEHSIRQIRPHVDFICVIYQKISWFGKPMPHADLQALESMQKRRLIDTLVSFSAFRPLPDSSTSSIVRAKAYERAKRQTGLELCLSERCTHFLCMDVDEFYDPTEFASARSKIEREGLGITAVRFINYVNVPTLHRGYDPKRVPFICKVSRGSKMTNCFFVKCDPTRGVAPPQGSNHEFPASEITMHHMETVRRDLGAKYLSTTRANFKRDKTQHLVLKIRQVSSDSQSINFDGIIYPGQREMRLTRCENRFNIPLFS